MSVLKSADFIGRQDDISKALGELAKFHGLRATCKVEPSTIAHTTMLEQQYLSIKVEDDGDPELIASPKVRTKAFLTALAGGLQRLCEDRGFRVYLSPRDGNKWTAAQMYCQDEPLTGAQLWAEYERSLELQEQKKRSILLRFVASTELFRTPAPTKIRTSTFI